MLISDQAKELLNPTHLSLRESCWSLDLSRSATEKLALPRKLLCGGKRETTLQLSSYYCPVAVLFKYNQHI